MANSISLATKVPDNSVSGTTDQVLWQAFRAGDRAAFARIYECYARKLLSYGRKVTTDGQRIEDAIQDLFIELWKGRENLSPTTSIQFYLFRALRNKLSRHRFNLPLTDTDSDELLRHDELLSAPMEAIWIAEEEETERLASLRQAIGQLSQRQQEAIHLRYYQQFDSRQIAELMEINDQSVRNLLYTALRTLKQHLISCFFYLIISLFC